MTKPKLNSLDRFRKQSDRLVLEAHSHCEVPAGCGGVVLRWRNPAAARPITTYLYAPADFTCFVDGAPLRSRNDLVPGSHVLGIHIPEVERTGGLLLAYLSHDPGETRTRKNEQFAEQTWKLVSAADGSWKATLEQPADDWATLAFDATSWLEMDKHPKPNIPWEARNGYAGRTCIDAGAAFLGLSQPPQPPRKGPVWIRRTFLIPPLP